MAGIYTRKRKRTDERDPYILTALYQSSADARHFGCVLLRFAAALGRQV